MSRIEKQHWGTLESGESIDSYTLRNANGIVASVINYGGRLVSLHAPDRVGASGEIVLGFDSLDPYLHKNPFFGALVGRYANRIAKGEFWLEGIKYTLARNNGENAMHGGLRGFDKVAWTAHVIESEAEPTLELTYLSADGEEGYPGNLETTVCYSLSPRNELRIDYQATTDKNTVLNLTNHSYFDLSGNGGDILDVVITINAERFAPVNAQLIPTGELRPVEGTPFDFRSPTTIGARINEPEEQLGYALGYDHNYVLGQSADSLKLAARAWHPKSGRVLEVFTTQPGMQFYTGNHLDSSVIGRHGKPYEFRSGMCFETQHFPDSPNHPEFPSCELRVGERYHQTTIFKLTTD